MALAMLVALVIVSDLLEVVGDGPDETRNEPRSWWQGKLSSLRLILGNAIPISAIRIVVVVLQIVVQVRGIKHDLQLISL